MRSDVAGTLLPRMTPGLLALTAVRAAWGTALVTAPERVLTAVTGRPPAPSQKAVLRVLGTRQILQAAFGVVRPTPIVLRLGGAADVLHAASCVAAVALLPAWRRPALVDGTAALGMAAAGLTFAGGR
jgi:hypothetical protein